MLGHHRAVKPCGPQSRLSPLPCGRIFSEALKEIVRIKHLTDTCQMTQGVMTCNNNSVELSSGHYLP